MFRERAGALRVGVVSAAWAAAVLALGPTETRAGAFTLEPGETKLFIQGLLTSSGRFFDRDGRRQSRGRYRKYDLQAFAEYGARDGVTLFGAAALQKVELRDVGTHDRKGLGRSEIGARVRLFEQDGWIVSAQGSAIFAGARKDDAKLTVVGESDDQADLRGLVAYSFEAFGAPSFIDLGGGYRFRGGDPADEIRLDAAFGIRPVQRLLLLAQNFNMIGTGRWSGPYPLKQRIHKIQAAAIYDLSENVSLIGSTFFTPAGQDSLDERGGSLGLGFRF